MSDDNIIQFDKNKRIGKEQVEDLIKYLKTIPPEDIRSMIFCLELDAPKSKCKEHVDTYYLTKTFNIGFSVLGYLDALLTDTKIELFNSVEPEEDPYKSTDPEK